MSNVNLGTTPSQLQVGRKLAAYTGVVIHAGQDDDGNEIEYSAGDSTGYVLDVDNPIGTQAMANAILAGLKLRGASYQPYEADRAVLDPSAEIGDSVTVNGNDSIIYRISASHSALMGADVAAPYDEELDHEFTYEPKLQREFKRESAYARARITLTQSEITAEVVRATNAEEVLSGRITIAADGITAEVTRATAAEAALSSRITINADAISAEVSRATGEESRIETRAGSIRLSVSSSSGSSTFTLTDNSGTLDTETLDLSVKSVNISGTLTASQISVTDLSAFNATIGGFTITASSMYNGMTSLSDATHNGVYIGTDGIALGAGAFKATASGSVYLKGTITFLNTDGTTAGTLSAADLQLGASKAATGYSSWDSAYTSTTSGGYCYGGAGYGYSYNNVTTVDDPGTYPAYFKTGTLRVTTRVYTSAITIGSYGASWRYCTVKNNLGVEEGMWLLTGQQ